MQIETEIADDCVRMEQRVIARERLMMLKASLREADFEPLILDGSGLSSAEIADKLGTTSDAVRARLMRVRRTLVA